MQLVSTDLQKTELALKGLSLFQDAASRLLSAESAMRGGTKTPSIVVAELDALDAETADFLTAATELASSNGLIGQFVTALIGIVQGEKTALRATAAQAQAALDSVLNPQA